MFHGSPEWSHDSDMGWQSDDRGGRDVTVRQETWCLFAKTLTFTLHDLTPSAKRLALRVSLPLVTRMQEGHTENLHAGLA